VSVTGVLQECYLQDTPLGSGAQVVDNNHRGIRLPNVGREDT
jgi:hypothetical protein